MREVEERKLRLEERKLRQHSWQVAAALAAAAIAVVAIWLQLNAQTSADRAQAEAARTQLLAQAGSAGECKRLASLDSIEASWPTYGESFWGNSFDVEGFCTDWFREPRPPSIEVQRDLVQQLADHPERWQEISAMWEALYPSQPWVNHVVAAFLDGHAASLAG
jgi:hypothetical protein